MTEEPVALVEPRYPASDRDGFGQVKAVACILASQALFVWRVKKTREQSEAPGRLAVLSSGSPRVTNRTQ